MANTFTTFLLRGGTREEHLTGSGTGFIGGLKEVTVDTTDNTLRVHDGQTVGGHPLVKRSDDIAASQIIFKDGESLQFKLDNGSLGGGGNPPEPPIGDKPDILAIDVKNKLQSGTATAIYYVKEQELPITKHELSINNGSSFVNITPVGNNPYEYIITNLMLGQNLCAIRVTNEAGATTKYFIVDIPNINIDTPPRIVDLSISEINTTGFKIKYKVEDDQGDDTQRHQISTDNGTTYKDIFPLLVNGYYETNITSLTPNTTYHCRVKVTANNIESLTSGFSVATTIVNS